MILPWFFEPSRDSGKTVALLKVTKLAKSVNDNLYDDLESRSIFLDLAQTRRGGRGGGRRRDRYVLQGARARLSA